jgi:hypothetical protein
MRTFLLGALLSLSLSPAAFAEGHSADGSEPAAARSAFQLGLHGIGGVSSGDLELHSGTVHQTATSEAKLALGGGAFLDRRLSDAWSLETGLGYAPRAGNPAGKFYRPDPWLQADALIRFWPASFLTLGVGPYAARFLGDQADAEGHHVEYGWIAALGGRVPIHGPFSGLLEARYQGALTDAVDAGFVSGSTGTYIRQRFNTVQGLAGLTIDL